MSDFFAEGGAGSNGYKVFWTLVFDDTANTITINATHARFDGSPAPAPQKAWATFQLNSGQPITVDLLAGEVGVPNGPVEDPKTILTNRQPFDQTAGSMLNAGDRVRTNVRLRVSAGRAAAISHSTQYKPPA